MTLAYFDCFSGISGDMVLGVDLNGDVAAWPVNQLSYHHVVNTEVGGIPIAATY